MSRGEEKNPSQANLPLAAGCGGEGEGWGRGGRGGGGGGDPAQFQVSPASSGNFAARWGDLPEVIVVVT